MPYSLSDLQKEYLDYIREYIRKNECSPRLDEIANAFHVQLPTAHKMLEALQSKGFLYFRRDKKDGFFIRIIERLAGIDQVMEIPIAGRVGEYGEVVDFPELLGHFCTVFSNVTPESTLFALTVSNDIPQASILAGDYLIFEEGKKPQPGDICIAPIGKRMFLIRVVAKTIYREYESFKAAIFYPIPNELIDPVLKQWLFWYPLAYDEDTQDTLEAIAREENWFPKTIPPDFIAGVALRLTRRLMF